MMNRVHVQVGKLLAADFCEKSCLAFIEAPPHRHGANSKAALPRSQNSAAQPVTMRSGCSACLNIFEFFLFIYRTSLARARGERFGKHRTAAARGAKGKHLPYG
jgi:hypothetical protein